MYAYIECARVYVSVLKWFGKNFISMPHVYAGMSKLEYSQPFSAISRDLVSKSKSLLQTKKIGRERDERFECAVFEAVESARVRKIRFLYCCAN